ncbi:hypothetical protein BaRGS_00006157, partial [Batillaria attramentaria]
MLGCLTTYTLHDNTYVILVNMDPRVDNNNTYRFVCMKMENINKTIGKILNATVFPESCSGNNNGGKMLRNVEANETSTDFDVNGIPLHLQSCPPLMQQTIFTYVLPRGHACLCGPEINVYSQTFSVKSAPCSTIDTMFSGGGGIGCVASYEISQSTYTTLINWNKTGDGKATFRFLCLALSEQRFPGVARLYGGLCKDAPRSIPLSRY